MATEVGDIEISWVLIQDREGDTKLGEFKTYWAVREAWDVFLGRLLSNITVKGEKCRV